MKRDTRLHGLTSDHHHALVLAMRVRDGLAAGKPSEELLDLARSAFASELAPHFAVEEEVLLTALDATPGRPLADRTRREHQEIKADLAAAEAGDVERLLSFANRLTAHVRFEEGELFVACERLLPDAVMEEAARRAPKPGP